MFGEARFYDLTIPGVEARPRVLAGEIVHPVALCRLIPFQEAPSDELAREVDGVPFFQLAHMRGGGRLEAPREDPEAEPESPRRLVQQVHARCQHGHHELRSFVGEAQPIEVSGRRKRHLVCEGGGRCAQGEREVPAEGSQLRGRGFIDARRDAADEGDGVRWDETVEAPCAEAGEGEALPGRHDHEAPRKREQRLELLAVARIVEQEQRALVVQNRAVPRSQLVRVLWQLRLGLERADDPGHHGRCGERLSARAAEIDLDLPVRVVVGEFLSKLQGERRLTDSALAGQRQDGGSASGELRAEPGEVLGASCEIAGGRAELVEGGSARCGLVSSARRLSMPAVSSVSVLLHRSPDTARHVVPRFALVQPARYRSSVARQRLQPAERREIPVARVDQDGDHVGLRGLVTRERMLHFVPVRVGGEVIDADEEHDDLGRFDPADGLPGPVLAGFDVPLMPGANYTLTPQDGKMPLQRVPMVRVGGRVGDENVDWRALRGHGRKRTRTGANGAAHASKRRLIERRETGPLPPEPSGFKSS
ncbi:hypothetical protein WMF39_00635 [Sorangium sp. So ce1504]